MEYAHAEKGMFLCRKRNDCCFIPDKTHLGDRYVCTPFFFVWVRILWQPLFIQEL